MAKKKNVKPEVLSPKLFIATPMYGGMCAGFYAQSLIDGINKLSQAGVTTQLSFMFNESLIPRARNALTQQFLKSDCNYMMFIDADIKFDANDILPMIAADKDIICGVYPKKEIAWNMVRNAINAGVPDNELKHHTGSFVVNLIDYNSEVTVPINQPVEIWNGGTGFMLIKRSVFDTLKKTVPVYRNDVVDLSNNLGFEEVYEFFACSIDETRRLLSEDFHFCKIARDAGMKVWAAPWVNLSHIGTYAFEGLLTRTE